MGKLINFTTLSSNSAVNKYKLLYNYANYIKTHLPLFVQNITIYQSELEIKVQSQYLFSVLFYLKNHFNSKFSILTDIIAYDVPGSKYRFRVVYHLLSIQFNTRIRVLTYTNEQIPIQSVIAIYPNADWFEREVWDLYGVRFEGHTDLRRILTDYGFQGHPLRKDFPLMGFSEIFYSDTTKRLHYTNIQLSQEYRIFEYTSPWQLNYSTDFL